MNVLVIESDPVWMQRIRSRLELTAARVWPAETWSRATEIMRAQWPDIMVIDYQLLQREAGEVFGALREGQVLPIIVPIAVEHGQAESARMLPPEEDALRRLEMLMTRLQGAFQPTGQLVRVGKLTIDSARKEIIFAARRIRLPPIEFRLLQYLALNANRVIDQQELLREVWGYKASDIEARDLVKAHVRHIRRKLGWAEDSTTSYLKTIRGFGYTLSVPRQDRIRRPKGRATGTPAAES